MKKTIVRAAALSALILGTSFAFAARLITTHDPAVIAELESGIYPMCQSGFPHVISGDVTWTCGPTENGVLLCCKTQG